MNYSQEEKTAYHEAGHTIIAYYYRFNLGGVSIIDNPNRNAYGTLKAINYGQGKHDYEANINVALLCAYQSMFLNSTMAIAASVRHLPCFLRRNLYPR